MNYIYCYTNKINNHKYVGQTNNLKRRMREHKSAAFNENCPSYNDLIHMKIREYGLENFEIEVLETLYDVTQDEVNKREQYWVEKLNTFIGNGQGYNGDLGGGNKIKNSILTEEQIKELKEEIKKGVAFIDLETKYNISPAFISSINHGVYFFDEKETYPLCKYYKNDADYDELIDLLLNSTLTLKAISEQLNMGYSTVKKINAGTLRHGLYPTYPIRKKSANEQRADKIKELLLTTTYPNYQIAKITNASEETVRRIKIGETYKDEKLSYPLGTCIDYPG